MRFTFAHPRSLAGSLAELAALGAWLLSLAFFVPPAGASSSCPNELLRTGPGANLPDCRAYELVSPPNKNGGEVDGGPTFESLQAPQQAALNGEAVTYGSQTTFPEANPLSAALTSQYLSRRGASGWRTQAITPEQDFPDGKFDAGPNADDFTLFQGFSENLEHGFLVANDPAPVAGAPAGYYNPYLAEDFNGTYDLLSTAVPPVQTPGVADESRGLRAEYAGMSADGTHVAFAANDALVAGAVPGRTNLYEWSDGRLELISVLPSKVAASGESEYPSVMFGDVEYGHYAQGGYSEGFNRVVSADGSRVIWTNNATVIGPGTDPEEGVYVSELTAGGRVLHGPVPGYYQTASVDGSKVYIAREVGEARELLQYEPASGKVTELAPASAGAIEVIGASEDGSYVYFDAEGALAPGAVSGLVNVYLWHEGAVSLVTTVSQDDYSFSQDGDLKSGFPGPLRKGSQLLSSGSVRVSPSGRYFVFESTEPLTGYDNVPTEAQACVEVPPAGGIHRDLSGRCVEVFEYDADTAHLTCSSCSPRGLPPIGNSTVPGTLHVLLHPPGWQSRTVQQRYLLDNGRVFFVSTDALLAQASNAGKLNVYEYEPNGVGGCQLAKGCLALISTGTSSENSYFIDASANGDDVFFVSRQQLVAQDGDEAQDVYDARVDGGFAAAVPPPCGGEACRPPITGAPAIYQAPPSATFAGPGNPLQPTTTKHVATKVKKKKGKSKPAKRKHGKSRTRRTAKSKIEKRSARGSRVRPSSRGSQR